MPATRIGMPLDGLAIWASAYGKEDGQDRIYAVSSGKPCVLLVIDPHNETLVERFPLEGSDHCWGVVNTPTGVYIGGSGILYRYTPAKGVEDLGTMIEGEYYTWRLAADEDGNVYGGCFPGGKVFQYNPHTGLFRDYGAIVEGEQYARSMAPHGKTLYVGMGTKAPHLIALDTVSGEKRSIPLPERCKGEQVIYDLDIVYPKLLARVTPSSVLHVYDLEQEQWVDELENASGLSVSPPDPDGRVYFIKDDYLHRYDPQTGELKATSCRQPSPAGDYGWLDGHSLNRHYPCLVGVNRDGSYWVFDPEHESYQHYDLQLTGQPVAIQSLTPGPDHDIYIGGYFTGGLARYDVRSGELQQFKGIGQTEGLISGQGKLYLGVYPKAIVYEYDPKQPWVKEQNPKRLFSLQKEEQDRPFALAWAGKELAIGTVSGYGRLGGALTLYDPESGQYEVYRNVIDQQSLISLAVHDGILYAGSSVFGGLGGAPSQKEAMIMMWDIAAKKPIWRGVPVPGEKAISALAVDDQGYMWGLTAGKLFQFDLRTRETVMVKEIAPFDWADVGHFWRGGRLNCKQGNVYGYSLHTLFRYNPAEDHLDVLDEDAHLFAEDEYGRYYFARDTELYQYEDEITKQTGSGPDAAEME
ncbi:WD40 repeat domain-containing protein [Paenibacillus senegalensis]|uniref:WD40 repeat domain-containing protein n=1 Tax=Paenibacillus senegalensis TaxID=1465766 RepID=UPI000287EAF9|nr:WD40 repeat domain-containing protein [Paenibacillus senegalensis]